MEAEIVRDRLNGLIMTDAVMIQAAIASVLSKDAAKEFSKLVETLGDG